MSSVGVGIAQIAFNSPFQSTHGCLCFFTDIDYCVSEKKIAEPHPNRGMRNCNRRKFRAFFDILEALGCFEQLE
jgi:hypothetical protein